MSSVTLASLSLFFQLEHRQNKGRLVLVSGANGVSIAATLVEANNTNRVNEEIQGPFDPVAKIHKEYNTTHKLLSICGRYKTQTQSSSDPMAVIEYADMCL